MPRFHLPLLMQGHTRGKRSAVTCALKCASQCAGEACNRSANGYFRDVVDSVFSRRTMMGGTLGAVAIAVGGTQGALAAPTPAAPVGPAPVQAPNGSKLEFTPIAPVDAAVDELRVPEGFAWHPIIKWGEPLFADAPEFDWNAQSAEAQKQQFGYNNDYTEIQEIPGSDGTRAVMFVNHEYTNPNIMFPPSVSDHEALAISMAAQGLTVVELERESAAKPWTYVQDGKLNRRFLIDETEFAFTGPAAGSDLLKTKDDPEGRTVMGTFANCSGGLTPWGTLLSGEENYHGYFRADPSDPAAKRYGFKDEPSVYGFENLEDRFDATKEGYQNEINRFGYIIEIDPWDPTSTPTKHTSLGRFKHEGSNVIVAENGKVVAYTGDDEKFEYLYKFVSRDTYREGDRAHNKTLLSEGDLYVAQFTGNSPAAEIDGSGRVPTDRAFDGSGTWLPLVVDGESKIEGMSVEEVLVHTRLAADAAHATKMDRPEDVEPSLRSRKVYMACTNNSDRGKDGKAAADEPNPRTENRDGHVIEIDERGDQTSAEFAWNILLVAGDVAQGGAAYFSGFPAEQVSPISCPDNLAFDSVGNLWISTDGAPSSIGYCDGLFRVTLDGAERGKVEQFLSVPRESETCGPIVRDQEMTAFVSVQHPGENGEWGEQRSFFPDFDGTGPRPTVVQVLPVEKEEPKPEDPTPEPKPEDPTPEPKPEDPTPEPKPEDPKPEPKPEDPKPEDPKPAPKPQGPDAAAPAKPAEPARPASNGSEDLARTGFGVAAPAAVAATLLGAGGAALAARRGSSAPAAPAEDAAEQNEGSDQE